MPAPEPAAASAKRAPAPRFIELGEDDRARIYETGDEADTRTPEQRLDAVADALTRAEIRDDVADLVLAYCAPYLRRRVLLIRRDGRILGWRGEGEGVTVIGLRGIDVPGDEPSLFANLDPSAGLYVGPLSPFPAHRTLQDGLGTPPRACVVIPIKVRDRIACYLYGDNMAGDLDALPAEAIERLARKVGTAFEVIILKNKIRRL